jgi:hypothetical protein
MQTFDYLGSKIFRPVANGGEVPELGFFLTLDGNLGFAIDGVLVFEIDADGSIIPGNLAAFVEALKPYYAVEPPAPNIVEDGVATVMAVSEYEVQINKTISASHTVTLPPSPIAGQIARVSDGKGDLLYGAITITVQGDAGATINNQANHVLDGAWGCATYRWSGTQWNIVGLV